MGSSPFLHAAVRLLKITAPQAQPRWRHCLQPRSAVRLTQFEATSNLLRNGSDAAGCFEVTLNQRCSAKWRRLYFEATSNLLRNGSDAAGCFEVTLNQRCSAKWRRLCFEATSNLLRNGSDAAVCFEVALNQRCSAKWRRLCFEATSNLLRNGSDAVVCFEVTLNQCCSAKWPRLCFEATSNLLRNGSDAVVCFEVTLNQRCGAKWLRLYFEATSNLLRNGCGAEACSASMPELYLRARGALRGIRSVPDGAGLLLFRDADCDRSFFSSFLIFTHKMSHLIHFCVIRCPFCSFRLFDTKTELLTFAKHAKIQGKCIFLLAISFRMRYTPAQKQRSSCRFPSREETHPTTLNHTFSTYYTDL